jgi:hypothetical protein
VQAPVSPAWIAGAPVVCKRPRGSSAGQVLDVPLLLPPLLAPPADVRVSHAPERAAVAGGGRNSDSDSRWNAPSVGTPTPIRGSRLPACHLLSSVQVPMMSQSLTAFHPPAKPEGLHPDFLSAPGRLNRAATLEGPQLPHLAHPPPPHPSMPPPCSIAANATSTYLPHPILHILNTY